MRWVSSAKPKKDEIRVLRKFALLPKKNVLGSNGVKFTVWLELYERIEQWHVPDIHIQFAPEPYWEHVQDQIIPHQLRIG